MLLGWPGSALLEQQAQKLKACRTEEGADSNELLVLPFFLLCIQYNIERVVQLAHTLLNNIEVNNLSHRKSRQLPPSHGDELNYRLFICCNKRLN